MSKCTWNQNGPGSKSLSIGRVVKCERACPPERYGEKAYRCWPDIFYAVRLIPAHRRWQYQPDERYEVEYSERHSGGRWVKTIGHARTQAEGKAIAEQHMEQQP